MTVTCLKGIGLCIPLCLLEMLKIPSSQLVNLPYILLFATCFDFLVFDHFRVAQYLKNISLLSGHAYILPITVASRSTA
jgi:hypothetical protein